jgi:hypothetical protein
MAIPRVAITFDDGTPILTIIEPDHPFSLWLKNFSRDSRF